MADHRGRSGTYRTLGAGVRAFYPSDVPPSPRVDLQALEPILSEANIAIGRLDSITDFLPNPDLFVFLYVRKEAVLSSQIEGTRASLDDLFRFEAGITDSASDSPSDVDEVSNYIKAMNFGLERSKSLPLSLRLLCEIHKELLSGVRGTARTPGEFRRIQNWIGRAGASIESADFIPPPPSEISALMANLEDYIRTSDGTPALVQAGIAHVQFETIHPFLDGNGRLGRLLITFMLCHHGVLREPLLYLSAHFKEHQSAYYDWLMRVRETGDWEGWLRFYLEGVRDVAGAACATARSVLALQSKLQRRVQEHLPASTTAGRLLDLIYTRPVLSVQEGSKRLGVTFGTANKYFSKFEAMDILQEITGRGRDRVFRFHEYIETMSPE